MDSQYRKNLKDLATACKNYVDETKEQILWQVGQYNITTQDDNTTAYQKVVPTGATRAKIKSIGGMSYKSENLLNESNFNASATSNHTFVDGVLASSGIDSRSFTDYSKSDFKLYLSAGTYQIRLFNRNITSTQYDNVVVIKETNSILTSNNQVYTNESGNLQFTITDSGNYGFMLKFVGDIKPMLVKGTTAPTEFKQGFTGIRDSVITSIKSYDSNNNLIDTYTIPSEIQALEGYGRGINENCYNELDLDTKVFTNKDSIVDLGTGSYTAQYNSFYSYSFQNYAYQQGQVKFLCSAYKEFNYNGSLANFTATDKNITFTANNMVWITDKQYGTDTTTFKNNASGVKLQYELATYNITDNLELPDNVIEVEEGGYLVFENQYGQAVPSNVTYRIEVAK